MARGEDDDQIATSLVDLAKSAYMLEPNDTNEAKSVREDAFSKYLQSVSTLKALPILSALIQPGRTDAWLRSHLVHALALLPLRPHGIRHVVEFVVSVHSSTADSPVFSQASTAETRGPSISIEALGAASKLLSNPPSDVGPEEWFQGIGPQLLALLDGNDGLEMIKAAAFIIGYGILGRRKFGAPNEVGWTALASPLLSNIHPSLASDPRTVSPVELDEPSITDLSSNQVLVSSSALSTAMIRLKALLTSHPNPGLAKRLLGPLLLPLWSISSWPESDHAAADISPVAFSLLEIYIQLANDGKQLIQIAQNLLYEGDQISTSTPWKFKQGFDGNLRIERLTDTPTLSRTSNQPNLNEIKSRTNFFVNFLKSSRDISGIDDLFLFICRRWLQPKPDNQAPTLLDKEDDTDYESKIVEAQLLQTMIEDMPDKLVGSSKQLLELIDDVLKSYVLETGDTIETEIVITALSLLNILLTSASLRILQANEDIVDSVKASTRTIAEQQHTDISPTAQNLLLLLDFRMTYEASPIENQATETYDRLAEDRRTNQLALSYISISESPPPVRAQGLDLISSLISSNSPVLDIPATIILLASLIQDEEEYIYLRIVKLFILLSSKHPKSVIRDILERYLDFNETLGLNPRLRLGETLMQIIQRAGETFTGDIAHEVCEGLLRLAGRRVRRPKQKHEQESKKRLEARKQKDAESAWDGTVPTDDDDAEEIAEAVEDNVILREIVDGWEGKRGEEDVRIRASALSIFGVALETNIAGIGSSIVSSALDLSVNVLALESGHEKAILRRSAVLMMQSFVLALDSARETGKRLGFGIAGQNLEHILRILNYIAETDSDGLVKQHAKDVVEGLRMWQVNDLVGVRQSASRTELGELAGLSVNPSKTSRVGRPVIEEVE